MSKYLRFDDLEPDFLTPEQMEPFVFRAMEQYQRIMKPEYGDALPTLEQAVVQVMKEHHLVLINGQYLLGYVVGSEWYSSQKILQEEFLIRIDQGSADLSDVMQVMCLLKKIHKVSHCHVGTRAAGNQAAIKRLYRKYGAKELMTIMRF